MADRRSFLLLMMTSLAGGFAVAGPAPALAKDDGKGGGDGGGGSGGGGDGGGDDGGGDDGGGDDGGDDGGDGGGSDDDKDDKPDGDSGKGDDGRIRDAVKRGEAKSLGKILPTVRRKYPGKVVRIRLTGVGSKMTYRIRLIGQNNELFEIRVNAQSGMIMGISSL